MDFVSGRRDLIEDNNLHALMRKVKAVIFDLDGTLTDSIGTILSCTHKTFAEEGLPQPDVHAIMGTIGLELSEGITRLLPKEHKSRGKEITAHYREIFISTPKYVEDHLFPGTQELMQKLKDCNIKIGFASGRSRTGMLRTINGTFLSDYCDALASGNEVPSKPNPAMMYKVCERLGIEPKDALGAGDASLDILMFQNAQAYALGVQSGVWSGDALKTLNPDALLPNISMLANYLDD